MKEHQLTLVRKTCKKWNNNTHHAPTDGVENTNSTNQWEDLLLTNKPRSIIHWSTDRRAEKKETKKSSVNWLQKYIGHCSAKLDNTMSLNVQDIRLSHKVYRENHEKLESWTVSRRKKLSWGENPERNLPGRCTVNITIYNSDDTIESYI